MTQKETPASGSAPDGDGIVEQADKRSAILDALARVLVIKGRLPRMHRHGWTGPEATSSVDYALFICDRDHVGAPTITRVSI